MRTSFATLVLVLSLAAVPSLSAKGTGSIQLCGAARCVTLDADVGFAEELGEGRFAASLERAAPAGPSPYYVLRYADAGGTIGYWVPSADLLRLGQLTSRWVVAAPDLVAEFGRATVGIAPRPAPVRAAATAVDFKPARGAATYLRLYTIGTPAASAPGAGGWLRIFVVGAETPWTDGANSLWISRRGGYLSRDGTVARISGQVAQRIRHGLPLA